jgi:xylulokinase
VILTIDLGTSVTKAAVWAQDGVVAAGYANLDVAHYRGGRVEQDPSTWWPSVVAACRSAADRTGGAAIQAVDAVAFTSARQTFVPVTGLGETVGQALLWSDRRAQREADQLAEGCGGADAVRTLTGTPLDGAAVAAKLAWLAGHEPERLTDSRWILSPRDLMVWEMTGVVATDTTLASVTGLYDGAGREVHELVGPAAGKLAEVVEPQTVIGTIRPDPARDLGVKAGTPVVIGAGDRACEVLGTGASAERPMVAWGTTANVSVPVSTRPCPAPAALTVTRGALGGWLLEGGLSAAGSFLAWVGALTGTSVDELANQALTCPPGAGGVWALPWPGGARAPWWRDQAGAGFLGLGFEHRPADLARAVLEAVAFDVARCLDAARSTGLDPRALAIGGSSATGTAWTEVLTGVTGLPAGRRRSGEAAMAGAALLASAALAAGFELDRLDPKTTESTPAPDLVRRYVGLRPQADRVAAAVLELSHGLAEVND